MLKAPFISLLRTTSYQAEDEIVVLTEAEVTAIS